MKVNITLQRLIYNILVTHKESRESWLLTIKTVHQTEMTISGIPIQDYFYAVFDERLSNLNTIKRVWSKIQEDIPKLRGENYADRQRQGGQYKANEVIDYNQISLFEKEELTTISLK